MRSKTLIPKVVCHHKVHIYVDGRHDREEYFLFGIRD